MSRLPRLTDSEAVRALQKAVVPVHKGEDLGSGILSKILRDAELSRRESRKLL